MSWLLNSVKVITTRSLSGIIPSRLLVSNNLIYNGTRISTRWGLMSTRQLSDVKRNTGKPLLSRKTFLLDYYKHLNDTNEIILYVHHNNLNKNDNKKIRFDLTNVGAKLNVIRSGIYKVYLRSEHEEDPADKGTSEKNKDVVHPLFPLFNGPTAIITIAKTDPRIVEEVLKILKAAHEKLFLVGARVGNEIYDIQQVDQFKDLPNKEQLQGQLAGVLTLLGGAGLVKTLESSTKNLYLTMKQHVQSQEEKE